MSLTRSQLETVLVRRLGTWLSYVSLTTTVTGNNTDLADPIAQALLSAGYTVATITTPANSDLSAVTVTDYPKLLDLAELRTLETILQAFTDFDTKGLNYEDRDDQLGQRIEKAIARKRALIQQKYGLESVVPQAGTIDLNFQQQNDTTPSYYI
jgi:hypothetical protein